MQLISSAISPVTSLVSWVLTKTEELSDIGMEGEALLKRARTLDGYMNYLSDASGEKNDHDLNLIRLRENIINNQEELKELAELLLKIKKFIENGFKHQPRANSKLQKAINVGKKFAKTKDIIRELKSYNKRLDAAVQSFMLKNQKKTHDIINKFEKQFNSFVDEQNSQFTKLEETFGSIDEKQDSLQTDIARNYRSQKARAVAHLNLTKDQTTNMAANQLMLLNTQKGIAQLNFKVDKLQNQISELHKMFKVMLLGQVGSIGSQIISQQENDKKVEKDLFVKTYEQWLEEANLAKDNKNEIEEWSALKAAVLLDKDCKNPKSFVRLAYYYKEGRSWCPVNKTEAARLFYLAYKAGHYKGAFYYSEALFYARGIPQNIEEAKKVIKESVQLTEFKIKELQEKLDTCTEVDRPTYRKYIDRCQTFLESVRESEALYTESEKDDVQEFNSEKKNHIFIKWGQGYKSRNNGVSKNNFSQKSNPKQQLNS